MDVKTRIALVSLLTLSVTAAMGIYLKNAWPLEAGEIACMGIATMIVLAGLAGLAGMWNSMKTGQPLKDEMTTKITYKAGYYSWIATIYIALAVGWVIDDIPGMAPRHGSTAVLLLSALTFFIVLGVLRIRGDFE
ncbi:MAG: hypothetical protein ABIH11_00195 [Candidatus Altiarchaeota archaeon]